MHHVQCDCITLIVSHCTVQRDTNLYTQFTRLVLLQKWVWLVRLNIMQEQVKVLYAAKNL